MKNSNLILRFMTYSSLLVFLLFHFQGHAAQNYTGLPVTNLEFVAYKMISSTEAHEVYKLEVLNDTGQDIKALSATVFTADGSTNKIIDGYLSFGDISAGQTGVSADTMTIGYDPAYQFDFGALSFVFNKAEDDSQILGQLRRGDFTIGEQGATNGKVSAGLYFNEPDANVLENQLRQFIPGDVDSLIINFDGLELTDASGVSVAVNMNETRSLDLLNLSLGLGDLLNGDLPAGMYTSVNLILNASPGRVTLSDGSEFPLDVNWGMATLAITIDHPIEVIAGLTSNIRFTPTVDLYENSDQYWKCDQFQQCVTGVAHNIALTLALQYGEPELPFIPGSLFLQTENRLDIQKTSSGIVTGIASLDDLFTLYNITDVRNVVELSLGDAQPVVIQNLLNDTNIIDSGLDRTYVLSLGNPADTLVAMAGLSDHPQVIYAGVNGKHKEKFYPNDPGMWSSQTGYLMSINAFAGWNYTRGNNSVKVAVLDSGTQYDHPDLQGRVQPGPTFTDCSAFLPFSVCLLQLPHSVLGEHGTFVAGIIGANTDNAMGVAGINHYNQILSINVTQWGLLGVGASDISIIAGIIHAVASGSKVINMSLARPAFAICSPLFPLFCLPDGIFMHAAVKYAYGAGVTLVAAAGNNGAFVPTYGTALYSVIPAGFPEVLSVGAGRSGSMASYSNYGKVDVVAPGTNIYSTIPNDYGYGTGTSAASPIVAGVVSLMLARNPTLSPALIRSILIDHAMPVPGANLLPGAGIVDMEAVLMDAGLPRPNISQPCGGFGLRYCVAKVYDVWTFQFEVSGGTPPYHWSYRGALPGAPGTTLNPDTGLMFGYPSLYVGLEWTFDVIVTDSAGLQDIKTFYFRSDYW